MTHEDLKRLFPNASQSTLRRNAVAVGGLQTEVAESDQRSKKQHRQLATSKGCVAIRIEITSYRRRLLDAHDNLAFSFKRVTDRIAADLGVQDNDERIEWRFYQVKTDGDEGCTVRISVKNL